MEKSISNIIRCFIRTYADAEESRRLRKSAPAFPQPAVSQAVHQLETALGCRLFLRTSKGVKLTREGEVLHSYVKRGS